ncbi:prephenate dehydratase [Basidiobolus meristosporus CBS 931.73]|uniref:prephenate dehydratase n=1 Tax=Basidiobolus meristosporus CBS 931.73 TaxID=1314790 RepID=A0A1Y1Z8M3_9FUNG|nr:prephenate dehydratase [Basidiobolus meristosporus CBS 931.73]|eukprot:ORY06454.1 prephenate dehydratase [Basidiobolus meristosporus CBS 931.73]
MSNRTVLIGFQGARGAYADNAARHLFDNQASFRGSSFETIPFDKLATMFAAVQCGDIHQAILPVENSLSGTMHANFDKLLQLKPRLHVVGEYVFHEPYCLVALPGTSLEDITEVMSHVHVLEQCKDYLYSLPNGPSIVLAQGLSTADCASMVAEKGERTLAAIASQQAARLYDLEVLATGIEANPNTFTRYFLISKDPIRPERHMMPKTSFAVIMPNKPGALFKTLGSFAMRDINVLKIESRPSTRTISYSAPWEYIIYIDIDGAAETDPLVERAVDNLKEFASEVIVLGAYPRYVQEIRNTTIISN